MGKAPDYQILATWLGERFIQRWDMFHRQTDEGSYVAEFRLLTRRQLVAHLRGKMTLSTYILDQDSRARFVVLDADDEQAWAILTAAAPTLAKESLTPYLEASRRGGHMWFFLEQPVPGHVARAFGRAIAQRFEANVEVYPKQSSLDRVVAGSTIRLPFGIHRKSGKRYGFRDAWGHKLGHTIGEQLAALRQAVAVPANEVYQIAQLDTSENMPREPASRQTRPHGESLGSEKLSDRIKAAISVYDFVRQYVQLTPKGLGFCPFHEDRNVRSFSVNKEQNYWNCFAECGGGSIIDFWMLWRRTHNQDSSFRATLADLATMLGLETEQPH